MRSCSAGIDYSYVTTSTIFAYFIANKANNSQNTYIIHIYIYIYIIYIIHVCTYPNNESVCFIYFYVFFLIKERDQLID